MPTDSFDCHPTLSVLSDYFSHHHDAVRRAAHQQGEALQAALDHEQRLQRALGCVWREKERHKADASNSKARADLLQSSLTRLEDDRSKETKESERLKQQLTKERRERKEGEEREKASDAKAAELEKKLKATERRLTIADKKAARLEDADATGRQQLQAAREQLAAATARAAVSGSSSAAPGAEVAALRLKVSFYEGDQQTLHALSLSDLSALGGGLQASLDRVKEEQERRKECKLCLHELASVVFLPCEHMICCVHCSDTVVKQECPVCRVNIERRIQTKS